MSDTLDKEGFGANATGGEGGQIYEVTRRDDPIPAEPGTLRYALQEVSEPRIVVFRVGGVIELSEPIRFVQSDVTIAGQTVPGCGITVKGKLNLTSNTIVRYLRVRQGEESAGDCIEIWGTNNIIDHCSLSWAGDENIGFHSNTEPRNTTVQWCIISEGIKGILAGYGTHNVTFHHNLFAHNYIRNPYVGSGGPEYDFPQVFDIRNNVIYDVGNSAVSVGANANANIVGNYFKEKDTSRRHRYCVVLQGDPPPETIQIYLDDIYGPRVAEGEPEWNEVRYHDVSGWGVADEATYRVAAPFDTPPVTTHDPQTAYDLILANAGATIPGRDPVDERVVQEVRDGTGICPVGSSSGAYREFAIEQWAELAYEGGEEMSEYYYEPASRTVEVNASTGDVTGIDFVQHEKSYYVGGYVRNEAGDGVPDVTVEITEDSEALGAAITDESGKWGANLLAGNYVITPQ